MGFSIWLLVCGVVWGRLARRLTPQVLVFLADYFLLGLNYCAHRNGEASPKRINDEMPQE